MAESRFRVQGTGYRMPDTRCQMPDAVIPVNYFTEHLDI